MESLFYVYETAIRYLFYIFNGCICFLGLVLICSFIIDFNQKIKQRYKDEMSDIKRTNSRIFKRRRLKEAK